MIFEGRLFNEILQVVLGKNVIRLSGSEHFVKGRWRNPMQWPLGGQGNQSVGGHSANQHRRKSEVTSAGASNPFSVSYCLY